MFESTSSWPPCDDGSYQPIQDWGGHLTGHSTDCWQQGAKYLLDGRKQLVGVSLMSAVGLWYLPVPSQLGLIYMYSRKSWSS